MVMAGSTPERQQWVEVIKQILWAADVINTWGQGAKTSLRISFLKRT
jgi:hypothetical protein